LHRNFTKHHAVRMYGSMEIWIFMNLTVAAVRALCRSHFTYRERVLYTNWIGSWLGQKGCLDFLAWRKISWSCKELNCAPSDPEYSHYTDFAIQATNNKFVSITYTKWRQIAYKISKECISKMCDLAVWCSTIALDHGSPTCGPSGFIMQPTSTFVNYVYIIEITH